MDAIAYVYLAIALLVGVLLVGALLASTKQRPRGAALVFALALMFVPQFVIPENNSRELQLLEGTLRMSGLAGIFIGLYGLIRKLPSEEVAPVPPSDGTHK